VSVGFEHCAAISSRGALYVWGRGDRGQLGTGEDDTASYAAPVRVLGPDDAFLDLRVVAVECGLSQTACVTQDGRLWVWGKMQNAESRAALKEAEQSSSTGLLMADQLVPREVPVAAPVAESAAQAVAAEPPLSVMCDPSGPRVSNLVCAAASDQEPGDAASEPSAFVCGVTSGQAHTSFVTRDGRLFMMGMRGRGVQFDDSLAILRREAAQTAADGAPSPYWTAWGESLRACYGSLLAPAAAASDSMVELPKPEASPASKTPAASQTFAEDAPIAEVTMQVVPLEIDLGPLRGRRIVALRSSLHHSYAVTDAGHVFRWGWAGVVLPLPEAEGRTVRDVAFGYNHGVLLADE
jgi:alpha-tubulin suppressor-like RCC1 family protein